MRNSIIDMPLVGDTDSYKLTHYNQYPADTTKIFSYFESRGSDTEMDETTFFGLQYYIKQYLEGQVVNKEDVEYMRDFTQRHLGIDAFNYEGWMHIVNEHDGRLPIRIRAVPEGLKVPNRNVLMTVENTDPKCYWLTNYIETVLTRIWYTTTIASNSIELRSIVQDYYDETASKDASVDLQVHDFGSRGVSSREQAAVGGGAHLVAFGGTDTLIGIQFLEEFYGADMPGISIPASEHSTMTTWGGPEGEPDAIKNMLEQYQKGIVSIVFDSYNIKRAVEEYACGIFKEQILNRDGKVVIRPDSGDPVYTTEWIVKKLWEEYGGTVNDKGYKVLDPHIGIIQGDGIDRAMLKKILENFKKEGFSAENIVFGSGGGLLQQFNRDTFKFAFKASYREANGEAAEDVRKFPMKFDEEGNYEESFKYSKAGRLKLTQYFETKTFEDRGEDLLDVVFEDGEIKREQTFEEIRELAR